MPHTTAQHRLLPTFLLLVSAASWGGNWVAARAVTAEVAPFALSFPVPGGALLTSKR